jgi:glyoxylase-like metal-dependent hydrolase (beta-lactamase superfamily II)
MYAMRFGNYRMEPPKDVLLLDTERLPFAGSSVEVISIPGHTGGGVAYLMPGMAFTGDVLLRNAVGRTDLPGGNIEMLRQSVSNLLAVLAPATVLFPGHGKPWTAGEAITWWSNAASAPPEHRAFGH